MDLLLTSLDARLLHQIRNVLLQVVYPVAHVVDTRNDLIRHGLELVLDVLQQILNLEDNAR